MSLQIEPEIRHLNKEPMVLACDKCECRAVWFGVWTCCGADLLVCNQHASQMSSVVRRAQMQDNTTHNPCGTHVGQNVGIVFRGVPK